MMGFVFYLLQESFFCVFVEKGFLMLQGQQAGRELRVMSAEKVSLFVRWSKTSVFSLHDEHQAAQAFWIHVFVPLINCSTEILHPVSGQRHYDHHCRHVGCALRTKEDLHRSQSNELQGLLHWGSTGTAQTEVTKQIRADFTALPYQMSLL